MNRDSAGVREIDGEGQRVKSTSFNDGLSARLPIRRIEGVRPSPDLHQDRVETRLVSLLYHGSDFSRTGHR
jgi:hypothetical protein